MSLPSGLVSAWLGRRSPARRVAAWVLAVAGPALLTLAALPWGSSLVLGGFLFSMMLVVIVAAALGGARPALAAVVLGVLARELFFAPPFVSRSAGLRPDLVSLIGFAVAGAVVAIVIGELAKNLAELKASRARVVAAADKARRQIERDLHDGAQQRLVSLTLALRAVQAEVVPGHGELDDDLARIAEGLVDVQDDLREIARGIHPAILAQGGLGPALKALARRCTVPVQLDVRTKPRLPEPVEVAAYYVVAEALTNAAKYANASVIQVDAEETDRVLYLRVRDDGAGGADPVRGSGLVGLKDRVEALGGTIDVQSPAGAGTSLHAELPLAGRSDGS